MSAFTTLVNALFISGKPILGSTGAALNENLAAAMEGAVGAPRLYGGAVMQLADLPVLTVTAANTALVDLGRTLLRNQPTTSDTSVTPTEVAFRVTITKVTGTVRFKAGHQVSGGPGTSTMSLYQNGVLRSSASTSSATPVVISSDLSVVPGDVMEWRHRIDSAAFSSIVSDPIETASNGYSYALPIVAFLDL
jgi:hypothetical protein